MAKDIRPYVFGQVLIASSPEGGTWILKSDPSARNKPLRPRVNSPAFAKQMAAAYLALPHRCHQSRPRPTKPNGGVLCEDASRGSRTTPVPKEEHEETQTSPGVKPSGTKPG